MTYRVVYTDELIEQISCRIDQLREEHVSEPTLASWFNSLYDAIDDLSRIPGRYPIDAEESRRRGHSVRKLIFGDYIIRYRIDERRRRVDVMTFIHGSRIRES